MARMWKAASGAAAGRPGPRTGDARKHVRWPGAAGVGDAGMWALAGSWIGDFVAEAGVAGNWPPGPRRPEIVLRRTIRVGPLERRRKHSGSEAGYLRARPLGVSGLCDSSNKPGRSASATEENVLRRTFFVVLAPREGPIITDIDASPSSIGAIYLILDQIPVMNHSAVVAQPTMSSHPAGGTARHRIEVLAAASTVIPNDRRASPTHGDPVKIERTFALEAKMTGPAGSIRGDVKRRRWRRKAFPGLQSLGP